MSSYTCLSSPGPFQLSFIYFLFNFCIHSVNVCSRSLEGCCIYPDLLRVRLCSWRDYSQGWVEGQWRQSVVVAISAIRQILSVFRSTSYRTGLHFLAPGDGVGPSESCWPMNCVLKCCVCVCVRERETPRQELLIASVRPSQVLYISLAWLLTTFMVVCSLSLSKWLQWRMTMSSVWDINHYCVKPLQFGDVLLLCHNLTYPHCYTGPETDGYKSV